MDGNGTNRKDCDTKAFARYCSFREKDYYEALEDMGDLKTNYRDYTATAPLNCDEELKQLPTADDELCTALLTLLLREDHFCNGSFVKRCRIGQVQQIIGRMLEQL